MLRGWKCQQMPVRPFSPDNTNTGEQHNPRKGDVPVIAVCTLDFSDSTGWCGGAVWLLALWSCACAKKHLFTLRVEHPNFW